MKPVCWPRLLAYCCLWQVLDTEAPAGVAVASSTVSDRPRTARRQMTMLRMEQSYYKAGAHLRPCGTGPGPLLTVVSTVLAKMSLTGVAREAYRPHPATACAFQNGNGAPHVKGRRSNHQMSLLTIAAAPLEDKRKGRTGVAACGTSTHGNVGRSPLPGADEHWTPACDVIRGGDDHSFRVSRTNRPGARPWQPSGGCRRSLASPVGTQPPAEGVCPAGPSQKYRRGQRRLLPRPRVVADPPHSSGCLLCAAHSSLGCSACCPATPRLRPKSKAPGQAHTCPPPASQHSHHS